jgi:hypothetical protein
MRIQLRKYDSGYTICAYDSKGTCHINKAIDKAEFDLAFSHYFDLGYNIITRTDQNQSQEIYEIELP